VNFISLKLFKDRLKISTTMILWTFENSSHCVSVVLHTYRIQRKNWHFGENKKILMFTLSFSSVKWCVRVLTSSRMSQRYQEYINIQPITYFKFTFNSNTYSSDLFRQSSSICNYKGIKNNLSRVPGWLSQLSVQVLISAQLMI